MPRSLKRIIDTNVPVVANDMDQSPQLRLACVSALRRIQRRGHVVLDSGMEILNEYRRNLNARGQPGVGDAFFKWLWDNHRNSEICTLVRITPDPVHGYAECPPSLKRFDPSDKKFVAVAIAHPQHPPILQATDSKWWGWRKQLAACGVRVEFLAEDIEERYRKKMG